MYFNAIEEWNEKFIPTFANGNINLFLLLLYLCLNETYKFDKIRIIYSKFTARCVVPRTISSSYLVFLL